MHTYKFTAVATDGTNKTHTGKLNTSGPEQAREIIKNYYTYPVEVTLEEVDEPLSLAGRNVMGKGAAPSSLTKK